MVAFIWKSLHLLGAISHLLIPVIIAFPQFDKDFTLPALGDSPIQQVATPLNPAPNPLPDNAQWTSQAQLPDLSSQPQSLDLDLDNDLDTFDPSLIALSPKDTQPASPKSSPASASCAAKASLIKPGASSLLRREYGEMKPCCDPVNLGLPNPLNWLFGQTSLEYRSPYCCQGGGVEYARTRLCVPCMYIYISIIPFPSSYYPPPPLNYPISP